MPRFYRSFRQHVLQSLPLRRYRHRQDLLSNCIAKELLDRGHSVIYFTAFQLFDILSKGVFKRDEEALLSHRNIFDCDLLIIDDLGTELSNSFTTSQLFLCINERILRQKSTIISTNLGMNQLADIYSERVLSRISSNYTLLKALRRGHPYLKSATVNIFIPVFH